MFVGDTLFMPDVGSARADFPGGDAHQLYDSMRRLLALPPETTMYVCHDYPPATREARWQTTVAEQKAHKVPTGRQVNVFYWVEGRFGYAISAEADRTALSRLSSEAYRQLDVQSRDGLQRVLVESDPYRPTLESSVLPCLVPMPTV